MDKQKYTNVLIIHLFSIIQYAIKNLKIVLKNIVKYYKKQQKLKI